MAEQRVPAPVFQQLFLQISRGQGKTVMKIKSATLLICVNLANTNDTIKTENTKNLYITFQWKKIIECTNNTILEIIQI